MRAIAITALLSAAILAGCVVVVAPGEGESSIHTAWSSTTVKGNGEVKAERRDVASATALKLAGRIEADIRIGATPSLEIEADSNLLPLVRTEVKGDTLRVWIDGRIDTDNPVRVRYTVAKLEELNVAGSGRTQVSGLDGGSFKLVSAGSGKRSLSGRVDRLDANLAGSGSVDAAALAAGDTEVAVHGSGSIVLGKVSGHSLSARVHGSGRVQASGSVDSLSARIHGSGDANFAGLTSKSADLATHGSGDISAQVTGSVNASSHGSGQITVQGNPPQRHTTGKNIQVM